MSKRHAIRLAIALGVTWSGAALAAEGPMPAGTIAFSGERLTGFYHTILTASSGPISIESTIDHFSLLGMEADGPWNLPRIGIDGFVVDGLSIGGTVFVSHRAVSTDSSVAAGGLVITGGGNGSVTDFLIAPRVGYAAMFTDSVGMWPRAGVSYFHESISPDNGNDASLHFVSFELEAPFIFALTNGFALTAGPTLGIAIDGSYGQDNSPVDVTEKYTSFGLGAGFMGWL
jgi:hypothetical protein